MGLSFLSEMNLRKELLKKGFEETGPFGASELGEEVNRLYSKEEKPIYLGIAQGKTIRDDMDKLFITNPNLYMIYFK